MTDTRKLLQLKESKDSLSAFKAILDEETRNYKNAISLFEKDIISKNELNSKENLYRKAKSEYDNREAIYKRILWEFDNLNVNSISNDLLTKFEAQLNLKVSDVDKNSFEEIEKAIQNADIGLNPATDGDIIRIPIPALSEERRKELTKVASKAAEDTKVSIRSHRRTGIDQLSKLKEDLPADDLKRYEAQIQDLTDKFVQKIDELYKIKENELLEV